jgi:hypothetical protein
MAGVTYVPSRANKHQRTYPGRSCLGGCSQAVQSDTVRGGCGVDISVQSSRTRWCSPVNLPTIRPALSQVLRKTMRVAGILLAGKVVGVDAPANIDAVADVV